MQVFSLIGFTDYEGSDLLGVYGSYDDMIKGIERIRSKYSYSEHRKVTLGFDNLGYVVSELGSEIDVLGEVIYFE